MEYYILFQGRIDKDASLALINALLEANGKKEAEHITMLFSSVGGFIYYGFNIATVIKNLEKPIRIHATNEISSIANVVYLSAKERSAESYAKFFLHGASVEGNLSLNLEDLNEQVSSIQVQNDRLARFIFETTGTSIEEINQMMKGRRSLSSEEAFKYNIVLEVKEEQIPVGALRKDVIFV
ncbi:MAG: ATP-dependent Clp protease proteolytic subunit [Candidatus Niyogibacteria bacterium]|nr:MAG: ATP-dependent Clp protease proteolytic subunit [Candidatus Niyogibacteria bacterium]